MARLKGVPNNVLESSLPNADKVELAIKWLQENPGTQPHEAAAIWKIQRPNSLRKKWKRIRDREERVANGESIRYGGQNKMLTPAQEGALLDYITNHATKKARGATKRLLFGCIIHLREQDSLKKPSWRWFQTYLSTNPNIHTIVTKPIASHRVDMHTERNLWEWLHREYKPVLEFCGIKERGDSRRIFNMDEKGARIAMPAGQEIVVPIGIKEMYTGVPENRMSVTIIEAVCANGTTIPPVIIVPGTMIMANWFSKEMTGLEKLTVSESGYTNDGIMLAWLDHFIEHTGQTPESKWVVLLLDGQVCHEAKEFILKAKAFKIWLVKFPSHQTHLLQPLDVGCFRTWKKNQQQCLWDAIRSFKPEYSLCNFLGDLPKIRDATFTVSTIKHSFRDSGMWPLSFKRIKQKVKEYGRKTKKDLENLEYGEVSDDSDVEGASNSEQEEEQTLPVLPSESAAPAERQLPGTYAELRHAWEEMDEKIIAAVSSPTRANFQWTREANDQALYRASLEEAEVLQARASQVDIHKKKLTSRVSLQKGGSLLASVALEKTRAKEIELRERAYKSAAGKLRVEINKMKRERYEEGVLDRRAEKKRKKDLRAEEVLLKAGTITAISAHLVQPIRDREKAPTDEEKERDAQRLLPLNDAVAHEKLALEGETGKSLIDYAGETPINSQILEAERAFRIQRNPLAAIQIESSDDSDIEDMVPLSSPLARMARKDDEEEERDIGDGMAICASPTRSVASIDSIRGQDDFVRFH